MTDTVPNAAPDTVPNIAPDTVTDTGGDAAADTEGDAVADAGAGAVIDDATRVETGTATSPADGMKPRWHSAHVFYYDGDATDALLLNGVRPLITALRERGVSDAYFVRHWLRGPHVRVHVRTDPATWERTVRPLVDEIIGGYLRAHPSARTLDLEQEQRAHAWLAELEQEDGPLTPWFPDNSIQYLPYDRRLHVLGTEEAADHLAGFHVETTPLAFRILQDHQTKSATFGTLISLMLASAQIGCPPITNGYLSYRSHAEGFFANCGDPSRMRTRYEELYQANREPLAARLHAVLAYCDGAPLTEEDEAAIHYLPEWEPVARRVLATAEDLESRKLLRMPSFLLGQDARPGKGFENISDFHKALIGNEQVRDELASATWFTVYRVLLNFQYLLFSRLGITPAERFLLCHLAARTVEDANDLGIDKVIALLHAGRPGGGGPR
ncbi:thiopeptide maturation pyridine synthase [Thermopolyspora sp. NPDC052614]|uniref:thiopeptide maturation pyridine synthase n=1 Tax=Thermopolyspora sp. NPDC052614 TaxID=3155682 RepID=UPI0034467173